MMRRVLSILLFVFGGWMLMSEAITAFFDAEPGLADSAFLVAIFAVIAGLPLLLGAWASPGERWRELGLTILIATGTALICGICTVVVLSDPGMKQFLPPMPKINFAPAVGAVNLFALAVLGWLLYRPTRQQVDGD
jgi:cation transport ATPase